MNFYPQSRAPFDAAVFGNPSSEYRGAPLWSWNNRLDVAQLCRQIEQMKAMGLGGFHIHPRTGLDTEYLGAEFLEAVRACVEKARQEGMRAYLYDEDRWPSGFAGGLVTQNEEFRARHLLWTTRPYGTVPPFEGPRNWFNRHQRTENGTLLARYEVVLENGCLESYRRLNDGDAASNGQIWYAYLETEAPTDWFAGQTYVDTLNPRAMRSFIEATHERYAAEVGESFGGVIPSIFTDEPQFVHKESLRSPEDVGDVVLPWTPDLTDSFFTAYGSRLEDALPELFWELPAGGASLARYRFHDHVCERFDAAFSSQIGQWCGQHGLLLTGHVMEELTLRSQTQALGEAMRSYRSFGLPGIDILCDAHEYTTAKQAQSAVRQFARPGMMSELYGVTNWDYSFAGHKAQGDWQAALGVTLRVHHLTWVSMEGEAKRDYPASIGYQSPWFQEYSLVENHFARLNTVLTRGAPAVRIGVVHPIESYWLAAGPLEQTGAVRQELEDNFSHITNWLLQGMLDFDFISESLLPEQCPQSAAPLPVGVMRYDAVIVPGLATMRASTLERLETFVDAGGTLIWLGEAPHLIDAQPDERAQTLARRSLVIPWSRARLLQALETWREIEVRLPDRSSFDEQSHPRSAPEQSLLFQMRADGERRFLFVCNTDARDARANAQLRVRGTWSAHELDTLSGGSRPLATQTRDGWTTWTRDFPAHGHLLVELSPREEPATVAAAPPRRWTEYSRLDGPLPITLEEPNVLLLDQAQFRFDGGDWHELEELLRLENIARVHFGLPHKHGEIPQPWADTAPAPVLGTVEMRFTIKSEVAVASPLLAIERPHEAELWFNGQSISGEPNGWWVDEAIRTVPLPSFEAGTHELRVKIPVSRRMNLEWLYLLGDFGVRVTGRSAHITAPVRELHWGSWVEQGLPFYAGNLTYHANLQTSGGPLALSAPHFNAPLLKASLDGAPPKPIAFAPFRVELGEVAAGQHQLDITAFGNRYNAFGQLHNADQTLRWFGPPSWRTEGAAWSYEYRLKPMGILSAPIIEVHGA